MSSVVNNNAIVSHDMDSTMSRTSSSAMLMGMHDDHLHAADAKASTTPNTNRIMTPQDVQNNYSQQQNHVHHVPRFRSLAALFEKLRILIIGDRSFIWVFLTILGICAGFLGFVHDAAIAEIFARTLAPFHQTKNA